MKMIFQEHEITLRESFLCYIAYELLCGKSFQPTGLTDIINYFYCCVYVATRDIPEVVLDWKNFIQFLDEHPEELEKFEQWMLDERRRQAGILPEEEKLEKTDNSEEKTDNDESKKN